MSTPTSAQKPNGCVTTRTCAMRGIGQTTPMRGATRHEGTRPRCGPTSAPKPSPDNEERYHNECFVLSCGNLEARGRLQLMMHGASSFLAWHAMNMYLHQAVCWQLKTCCFEPLSCRLCLNHRNAATICCNLCRRKAILFARLSPSRGKMDNYSTNHSRPTESTLGQKDRTQHRAMFRE